MVNCNLCNCSCKKVLKDNIFRESLLFDKGKCIICKCYFKDHYKENKEIVYKLKEDSINYYNQY